MINHNYNNTLDCREINKNPTYSVISNILDEYIYISRVGKEKSLYELQTDIIPKCDIQKINIDKYINIITEHFDIDITIIKRLNPYAILNVIFYKYLTPNQLCSNPLSNLKCISISNRDYISLDALGLLIQQKTQ